MKKLTLFLLLSLVSVSAKAEEQPAQLPVPTSLLGYSLGMTVKEAETVNTFTGAGHPDEIGGTTYIFNADVAGTSFNGMVKFLDETGKLAFIFAKFASDKFQAVSEALKEKYGEGRTAKSIVQTGAGVEHEQIDIYWNTPSSTLFVSRFVSTIAESGVSLYSLEYMQILEENKTKKSKEMKKGL